MIKEILSKLTADQRKQLIYALENGVSYSFELENNHVIGVNIINMPNLAVIDQQGDWVYGIRTA